MEQTAEKLQHDYWRPVTQNHAPDMPAHLRAQSEVCEHCGSEFVIGARFCHVCGGDRQEKVSNLSRWTDALDFDNIRHALGLSTASLVAFIFGMAAVLAAFAVGFIYSATTLVDWQAVQTWRIEWMLAATVAFVAGILLKKSE